MRNVAAAAKMNQSTVALHKHVEGMETTNKPNKKKTIWFCTIFFYSSIYTNLTRDRQTHFYTEIL